MTNSTPLTNYPYYLSPYSRVQPFTYRDSMTFIERLEGLSSWITGTLVPHVDSSIETLAATVLDDINKLATLVNSIEASVENAELVNQRTNELMTDLAALSKTVTETQKNITEINSEAAETLASIRGALQDELDKFNVTWGDVTGKPSSFAPSEHKHPASDITDIIPVGSLPTRTNAEVIAAPLDMNSVVTPGNVSQMISATAPAEMRKNVIYIYGTQAQRLATNGFPGQRFIQILATGEAEQGTSGVYAWSESDATWKDIYSTDLETEYSGSSATPDSGGSVALLAKRVDMNFSGLGEIELRGVMSPEGNFGGSVSVNFAGATKRRIRVRVPNANSPMSFYMRAVVVCKEGSTADLVVTGSRDSASAAGTYRDIVAVFHPYM